MIDLALWLLAGVGFLSAMGLLAWALGPGERGVVTGGRRGFKSNDSIRAGRRKWPEGVDMARGGKRPGAGRPRGAINKLSAAATKAAAATGMLPHEILMRLGRGEKVQGFDGDLSKQERIDCLKASAPFYAPKLLGAVVKTPGDGNPWTEIMQLVGGKSRGLPAERGAGS